MTDPLKLAEEIEATGAANAPLIAAAIRLAEARFALDAHDDDEPTEGLGGEWIAWIEERGVLHLRVVDAAVNYEQAREGK